MLDEGELGRFEDLKVWMIRGVIVAYYKKYLCLIRSYVLLSSITNNHRVKQFENENWRESMKLGKKMERFKKVLWREIGRRGLGTEEEYNRIRKKRIEEALKEEWEVSECEGVESDDDRVGEEGERFVFEEVHGFKEVFFRRATLMAFSLIGFKSLKKESLRLNRFSMEYRKQKDQIKLKKVLEAMRNLIQLRKRGLIKL